MIMEFLKDIINKPKKYTTLIGGAVLMTSLGSIGFKFDH